MNKPVKEPWLDDEIEFLSGDWVIQRAEYEGLYNYAISGIWAHTAVDAVQLIEWKMARIITYEALTPWKGSGITFTADKEILRNLVAGNDVDEKSRDYIIAEGFFYSCVNKFYLIWRGFAECDASVEREITRAKVTIPKSVVGIPWPNDKIIVTPSSDCEITRAYSEGRYRVSKGGSSFTRTAQMLIDDGLAKSLREAQLEKLAERTKTNMSRLGELTCGFWYSSPSEQSQIKSLRDIARLWHMMEKGVAPNVQRLIAERSNVGEEVTQKIESAQKAIAEIESKLRPIDKEITEYKKLLAKVKEFSDVTLFDNVDKFDNIYSEYSKRAEELNVDILVVPNYFTKLKEFKKIEIGSSAKEVKKEIFPLSVSRKLDEAEKLASKAKTDCEIVVNRIKTLSKREKELRDFLETMRGDKECVVTICEMVKRIKQRQTELDGIAKELDASARKPKNHVFNHTYKYDNIKYTTALKIKHLGNGMYSVPYLAGTIVVVASELIYLNLAKRI